LQQNVRHVPLGQFGPAQSDPLLTALERLIP
jgi:hypothetical protein